MESLLAIVEMVPRNAKQCVECGAWKFRNGNWSEKAWTDSSLCRGCSCRKTAISRRKHNDRSNLQKAYNIAKFGITIDQYNEMWDAQNGCCASCGRPEADCGTTRLAVDHDHSCCSGKKSCGKCVRGLLCSQCNTAAGLLGDDLRRIESLYNYIAGAGAFGRSQPATTGSN